MLNNEKNFSNSNFVNQGGGCLFQQTKNGLRTKFKTFNHILNFVRKLFLVC
jgi:hypothetical protein